MIESGVIDKDHLANSKVAMVYGQMNEPLRQSWRRADRADHGRVLSRREAASTRAATCCSSSTTSTAIPGRHRRSALLGRMPSAVGSSRRLPRKWGCCRARHLGGRLDNLRSDGLRPCGRLDRGSSPQRPSPTWMRRWCCRGRLLRSAFTRQSIRCDSTSRQFDAAGGRARALRNGARRAGRIYERYKELQDMSRFSAWTSCPKRTS